MIDDLATRLTDQGEHPSVETRRKQAIEDGPSEIGPMLAEIWAIAKGIALGAVVTAVFGLLLIGAMIVTP